MFEASSTTRSLQFRCTVTYLILVALEVCGILAACQGHFIFPLDDTYIHLALAENIAHGHYAINPGQFASPASSVIWPFLLVPFAGTRLHQYFPILLNVVFGILSVNLLALIVRDSTPAGPVGGRSSFGLSYAVVVLLTLTADLPSLTVLAMEHGLQVLLAICCAFGFTRALRGREVPAWVIGAAVLAPSVRYEDLSLTLAVSLLLFVMGRRLIAALAFLLALAPLLAFSFVLHRFGLPLLPTSVLQKSGSSFNHPGANMLAVVRDNITLVVTDPLHHAAVVLLFLVCAGLAVLQRTALRRTIFAAPALVCALHLAIGHFGWLHRYEVYATVFPAVIVAAWWHQKLQEQTRSESPVLRGRDRGALVLAGFSLLLVCAAVPVKALYETPLCSQAVYRQQFQLHRFLSDYYHGNIMLNDLGAAAFQRRPGVYIFDFAGLGSPEAQQHRPMQPEWIQSVADQHDIRIAAVYRGMWPLPSTWTDLGSICEHKRGFVILAGPCFTFYSTGAGSSAPDLQVVQSFARSLPPGVWYEPR